MLKTRRAGIVIRDRVDEFAAFLKGRSNALSRARATAALRNALRGQRTIAIGKRGVDDLDLRNDIGQHDLFGSSEYLGARSGNIALPFELTGRNPARSGARLRSRLNALAEC